MQTQPELQNIKAFVLDTEARVDASGGMPHAFIERVEVLANQIREMGHPDEQPENFQRQIDQLKNMADELWNFSSGNTHLTVSMQEHIKAVNEKIQSFEISTSH